VLATVTGVKRKVTDLTTLYRGMVGSSTEKGFGKRDEQNWS